jgi:hypothetical protein
MYFSLGCKVGERNAFGVLYEKHRRLDGLIAKASDLVTDAQELLYDAKFGTDCEEIESKISQLKIELLKK